MGQVRAVDQRRLRVPAVGELAGLVPGPDRNPHRPHGRYRDDLSQGLCEVQARRQHEGCKIFDKYVFAKPGKRARSSFLSADEAIVEEPDTTHSPMEEERPQSKETKVRRL